MNHIRTPFLTALCTLILQLTTQAVDPSERVLYVDSGEVRIGIDQSKGAAVTWLSWPDHPQNIVNIHDPGRLIQQSYYAGRRRDRTAEGQHKRWSPWRWNPIQGGGVGSWARVTRFENHDDHTLFAETIPRLWDMPAEEAAAVMQQWTSLEADLPGVIVVRNRIVCNRTPNDAWGPAIRAPQETPACYFVREFDQLRSYLGSGQWRRESQDPGPPWGQTQPPMQAMACFNAHGQGVAVYSPTSGRTWNFGPHRSNMTDDPAAGPCVHMAPVTHLHLGPQSTYQYRYWLVVGDQNHIADSLDRLHRRYSNERGQLSDPD